MHGPLALRAEIFHRLDDADPEVHLPQPVHHHARGERVRRIDQPSRQAQPVVLGLGRKRRQDGRQPTRYLLAGLVISAAHQQEGVAWLRALLHYHHGRQGVGKSLPLAQHSAQIPPGLLHGGGRILIEEAEADLVGLSPCPLRRFERRDRRDRIARSQHGHLAG